MSRTFLDKGWRNRMVLGQRSPIHVSPQLEQRNNATPGIARMALQLLRWINAMCVFFIRRSFPRRSRSEIRSKQLVAHNSGMKNSGRGFAWLAFRQHHRAPAQLAHRFAH